MMDSLVKRRGITVHINGFLMRNIEHLDIDNGVLVIRCVSYDLDNFSPLEGVHCSFTISPHLKNETLYLSAICCDFRIRSYFGSGDQHIVARFRDVSFIGMMLNN